MPRTSSLPHLEPAVAVNPVTAWQRDVLSSRNCVDTRDYLSSVEMNDCHPGGRAVEGLVGARRERRERLPEPCRALTTVHVDLCLRIRSRASRYSDHGRLVEQGTVPDSAFIDCALESNVERHHVSPAIGADHSLWRLPLNLVRHSSSTRAIRLPSWRACRRLLGVAQGARHPGASAIVVGKRFQRMSFAYPEFILAARAGTEDGAFAIDNCLGTEVVQDGGGVLFERQELAAAIAAVIVDGHSHARELQ